MNKHILWLAALLVSLSVGFASCSEETGVADPYANWQERNEHYIDSIARVARANASGDWEIYKNYKLDLEDNPGNIIENNPFHEYDSVYVKVLKEGDGIRPMFTDTVYVSYQGFLINGERFDGNFTGTFNPEVHESNLTGTANGFKTGFSTALLYMKEGTFAEVYIPYQLGYGVSGSGSAIPGYSTLKFELYLDKVVHPKADIPSDSDTEE